MKYQNYLHFKLPITMNPEDYGKVIEQNNNKYIIQLNTNNIVIIKQINEDNFVKFFRKGELIFEFKDSKLSEKRFIRTILDQRYTFRDGKLISTEIISTVTNILIFKNYKAELFILFELFLIFLVYIIFFVIFPEESASVTSTAFSKKILLN